METSDSEYFESADEDFQSDDEDTKTVTSVGKTKENIDEKCINEAIQNLEHVKLAEGRTETNLNNNKQSDESKTEDIHKNIEDNINSNEVSKIVQKEASKKLGTKLGTKSVESVTNTCRESTEEISNIVEEAKDITPRSRNTEEDCKENICAKPKDKEKVDNIAQDKSLQCKGEENLWDESEIDWGKEDNMWDNDDWGPMEESPQKTEPKQQKVESPKPPVSANSSWGTWGSWDVSSIISTATQSVSTLTQGITTAIETGIGVPDPEELAKINKAEKEKLKEMLPEEETTDKNTGFGLGNLVMGVSQLTKLVETTGTKVISGGLDTLETIGKKTMEVLQEGDPGLKKKRAFLKIDQDKPVLSQLLREAKEKAEQENKALEEKHFAKKAKNYETLFDDHQGLVHLEALEMLSRQCDIKLQTLLESYTDDALVEMQETMDQVKELCELPDEDEDEQANWPEIQEKLNSAVTEINISISYKKLIDTWEETETWLNNLKLEVCDARELHQQAVETLAQLTAIAVEQFHKAGELLLVKEHRSTADEADSLVQLTTSLTALIGIVAAKFSDKLNAKSSSSKEVNSLITNVFFEAANSSSYIQDAFQLLIPVLQVGAV